MRYLVKAKKIQNWDTMAKVFRASRNKDIVERSRRDDFWGAISKNGFLVGRNVLGVLWMEVREAFFKGDAIVAVPPDVGLVWMGEALPIMGG